MVPLDGVPAGVAAGVEVLPGEEAGLVTVVVVGADTRVVMVEGVL